MLVDFVVLCSTLKKNFVRFVLGNRRVERNAQTKQTLKRKPNNDINNKYQFIYHPKTAEESKHYFFADGSMTTNLTPFVGSPDTRSSTRTLPP